MDGTYILITVFCRIQLICLVTKIIGRSLVYLRIVCIGVWPYIYSPLSKDDCPHLKERKLKDNLFEGVNK